MKNTYFFINEEWYRSIDKEKGKCKHFLSAVDPEVIEYIDRLIQAAQKDLNKILYVKSIKDNYYNLVSELESKFNDICTNVQESSSKLNEICNENIFADENTLKEKAKNTFDTLLQELRGYIKTSYKIDNTEEYSRRFILVLKGFKEFLIEQKEGYELIFVYSNCPSKYADRRKTLIKLIRRTFQNSIINGNRILNDVGLYQFMKAAKEAYKEETHKEMFEEYEKFAQFVLDAESMFEVIKTVERKVVKNNIIVDFEKNDADMDLLKYSPEDREYWKKESQKVFGDGLFAFRKINMTG